MFYFFLSGAGDSFDGLDGGLGKSVGHLLNILRLHSLSISWHFKHYTQQLILASPLAHIPSPQLIAVQIKLLLGGGKEWHMWTQVNGRPHKPQRLCNTRHSKMRRQQPTCILLIVCDGEQEPQDWEGGGTDPPVACTFSQENNCLKLFCFSLFTVRRITWA